MERTSSANMQQAWDVACLVRIGWCTDCTHLKKFVKQCHTAHVIPEDFSKLPWLILRVRTYMAWNDLAWLKLIVIQRPQEGRSKWNIATLLLDDGERRGSYLQRGASPFYYVSSFLSLVHGCDDDSLGLGWPHNNIHQYATPSYPWHMFHSPKRS